MRIGAIEGGGTKMVLAVCTENGEILEQTSIPTKDPGETMPEMINYFRDKQIEALGIGFFGPIQLNRSAADYGCVTCTPKLNWQGQPVVKPFEDALGIPVGFDTDVNAAALGEATWGASRGTENSIYLTIGTGVGVGVISNGAVVHGMQHPEGGHILLRRGPSDPYKGKCPFHESCLEGLAAGPAIEARWGKKGYELADRAEVWELEAYYIAQGLTDMIFLLSPEKILLGGGVMHQTQLMDLIRKEVLRQVNGYLDTPQLRDIENYIVRPQLNDKQGVMGCVCLALDELKRTK